MISDLPIVTHLPGSAHLCSLLLCLAPPSHHWLTLSPESAHLRCLLFCLAPCIVTGMPMHLDQLTSAYSSGMSGTLVTGSSTFLFHSSSEKNEKSSSPPSCLPQIPSDLEQRRSLRICSSIQASLGISITTLVSTSLFCFSRNLNNGGGVHFAYMTHVPGWDHPSCEKGLEVNPG